MKKVDAFWEMRNLGKTVLEINFDENDTTDSLNILASEFETYDYLIAKVPKEKMDLIHALEDNGFRFMETQFELLYNLNKTKEPSSFVKKTSEQSQYKKVDTFDQLSMFLSKIEEDLFITDRISLDPLFGTKIAHKRYLNWLSDALLSDTSAIYEVEVKSRDVGFFYVIEKNSTTCYGVLASVYKKYRNSGLGLVVLESAFKYAKEAGYSKVMTRVSSNNLEALRVNINVGFECRDVHYILRKANFPKQDV
ncbi:GNAT family N-acetyltransferase [Paenibacillus eucommiae]|uniref:GNAT superfamily N-acetyltransferase n=1 Tax=Paenibacillus eucommiae TaxID=1355755 RepID=A0ABS4J3K4_9BACL|nr:GNAT family N-acetyltransferase [Paenibacillus eucommiae]MBP1994431.1 GNAT superfamily N-acetyltransferase [Paenibacillus eucommiae]